MSSKSNTYLRASAGASERRLFDFGLLRGWARVVVFGAALLIGFPEW